MAIFAMVSFSVGASMSISYPPDPQQPKQDGWATLLSHFFVSPIDTENSSFSLFSASNSNTTVPLDGVEEGEDFEERVFARDQHHWKFSEDVNAELDAFDKDMNMEVDNFTQFVLGGLGSSERQSVPPVSECAFASPHGSIIKHEYAHRQKRKHEHTTTEMFNVLAQHVAKSNVLGTLSSSLKKDAEWDSPKKGRSPLVHASRMWTFSHAFPTVLNHFPISLADDPQFNISVPFGSWKSAFFPVDDFLGHHQEAPLPRYLRPPQVLEPMPPLYTVVSRNAYVNNGHVVTCDGHMLSSGGCLWDFHIVPGPAVLKSSHHHDIVVPLCDTWCRGYYHFTHEHLPRLALVHGILTAPAQEGISIRLVLSHSPVGFVRHFLFDVLGIPKERVIWSKPVLGGQVVYPMPQRCGNTMTHLLHLMRDLVFRQMGLRPKRFRVSAGASLLETGKLTLVFAERNKLSRMPRNYDDLKDKLIKELSDRANFETIPRNATVSQQIRSFHNADIVLGPHGANIANMMWMRPGSHVIEIASIKNGNMCYYATAGRVGVQHHLLLHSAGKDSHFTLDYNLFKRHVVHAMDILEGQLRENSVHPLF